MALSASSIERIKRYVGWVNKPDGAVEALVQIVVEEVFQSAHAQAVAEQEAQESALGPF